jgi:cysteine synthase B
MSNILSAIGNTPLVDVSALLALPPRTRLLAKIEGGNPGGSVKDRPALRMVREAERSGALRPGMTIVEATSGNTGIALAMIGAAMGYGVRIVMPACASLERRAIIAAFGAELELTPAADGTDGAIERAAALVAADPASCFLPDQFANGANVRAHLETTGPEIWSQTQGEVDVVVAGIGTGGTLVGLGRFLAAAKPGSEVFGIEPGIGHRIQGLKNLSESRVPPIWDASVLAGIVRVGDEEAFAACRRLAAGAGIFCGMSSGAAVAGAGRVARERPGRTLVAILPDRGERYLSTGLFRSVCGKCPP